jgi:hypothetical protein
VGRSVLLFGSRDEIAGRLAQLRISQDDDEGTIAPEELEKAQRVASLDFELNWSDEGDLQATLYALEPPELPDRMGPGQAAQLSELLEYLHIRIRNLLNSVDVDKKGEHVNMDARQWQTIIDLQSRLSEYLRKISEP